MKLFSATTAFLFLFCFFLSWFGFFGVLTGMILFACFGLSLKTAPEADRALDETVERFKAPTSKEEAT